MSTLIALITDEELKNVKNNPYWRVNLKLIDSSTGGIIWGVDEINEGLPRKGDIISIDLTNKGVKDQREDKYSNIILVPGSFQKIPRDKIPQPILDKLFSVPKASQEQLEAAYKIIVDKSLYKDLNNFAFVMAVLAHLPKDKLFKCPAGKTVHHAFQGGLIIHSSEVLQICKGIVFNFPFPHFINQDVIFTAATLHDIGKVYTYETDDIGQINIRSEENFTGHVYHSMSVIEKVGVERKVDPDYLNEVLHAVAAHHNKPEFGAIKEPGTIEAHIVAQADYIGSRVGAIDAKLSPMKKNKMKLEDNWKSFGDRYIIGSAIKEWYNNE